MSDTTDQILPSPSSTIPGGVVDRAEANAGPVARSIENGIGGAVAGNPGGTASAAPSPAPAKALTKDQVAGFAEKVAGIIVQTGTLPNVMAITALQKIALKPSWRTGEFWLLVAIVIGGNYLALAGKVNGEVAYLVNAAAGLAYVSLRQDFKDKGHQAIENLLTVIPALNGALEIDSASRRPLGSEDGVVLHGTAGFAGIAPAPQGALKATEVPA